MINSKFELIRWSETFACKIKLIDDQHKNLVNLVNDMFNHVTGNEEEEREYFKRIILEAVQYIKVHFTTEEKIMKATKFSGYMEHKICHENFNHNVAKTISCSATGNRLSLFSFTKFLKDWILSHIAVMDKQYFVYLRKIATCKDDGKLSISMNDIQSAINNNKNKPSTVLRHIA